MFDGVAGFRPTWMSGQLQAAPLRLELNGQTNGPFNTGRGRNQAPKREPW